MASTGDRSGNEYVFAQQGHRYARNGDLVYASPNAKQYCTLGGQDFVLEGDEVESDYVFLCGVMWCGYGQEDAGRELLRATLSRDPDISTLAWAMFANGKTALRRNLKTTTDS